MPRTIWPSEANSFPAYTYWQLAFFLRSAVIVALWLIADALIQESPQLLTGIFASLKVDNHTIRAFGTNILSAKDVKGVAAGRVLSAYTWVVLSSAVLSVVYIWNSLIVRSWSFDSGEASSWNSLVRDCSEGSMCYSLGANNDIYHMNLTEWSSWSLMRRALWWELQPACNFFMDDTDSVAEFEALRRRDRRFRITLCHKLWPEKNLANIFGALCIGAAILFVQRAIFETLVLLMLRESKHRFRTFNVFACIASILFVILYLGVTIREMFWGISSCSADMASLIALAVILYQANRVCGTLKMLRDLEKVTKMKKLQETSLGQEIDRAFSGNLESQLQQNSTADSPTQFPPSGSNSTIPMRARAQNFLQKLLNKPPAEN